MYPWKAEEPFEGPTANGPTAAALKGFSLCVGYFVLVLLPPVQLLAFFSANFSAATAPPSSLHAPRSVCVPPEPAWRMGSGFVQV